MTSDIFRQRIEVIKEYDKKLKDAVEQTFEKNVFLSPEDSSAFPAEWVYKITEEHLKSLFLSVMDEDVAFSPVIKDWDKALEEYETKVEELRKAGMEVFICRPDERDCERTVLEAEVDYYYSECNFGGLIERENESYDLSDPEALYMYLIKL